MGNINKFKVIGGAFILMGVTTPFVLAITSCSSSTKIGKLNTLDELCRKNAAVLPMHTFDNNSDNDKAFLKQNITSKNIVNGFMCAMLYIFTTTYGILYDEDLKNSSYTLENKDNKSKLNLKIEARGHAQKVNISVSKNDDLVFSIKIEIGSGSDNNNITTSKCETTGYITGIVKANTDSPSEMSPINYPVLQFAYDFQPT
jgi:hypothetical protein